MGCWRLGLGTPGSGPGDWCRGTARLPAGRSAQFCPDGPADALPFAHL